jgi:TPR repeat protein
MKRTLLAASLCFFAAAWPLAAAADDDAARARALNPDALAQVLAGYEAFQSGDANRAIQSWQPVADVAPHQVQFHLATLIAGTDPALAISILAAPAEKNHADAQFLLGLLLESTGSPIDFAAAGDWYRQAAASGIAQAQNNLGVLYANGLIAPGDDGFGAEHWLVMAAAQGLADGQFNLASLYERGEAIPADPVRALAWFILAARQGHGGALTLADAMQAALTPAQLSQVNTLLDSGTLVPVSR